MWKFLKELLEPAGYTPPRACLDAFNIQFGDAVRTEWSPKEHFYEAIFYKDGLEHIASYDEEGGLKNYKMFLPKQLLPHSISSQLSSMGEIMNSVLFNNGHSVQYEVIIRESDSRRQLILFSITGEILKQERL